MDALEQKLVERDPLKEWNAHGDHERPKFFISWFVDDGELGAIKLGGVKQIQVKCSQVTDEGMRLLAQNLKGCKTLDKLTLLGGKEVTDEGIAKLLEDCPATLKEVVLSGLQGVTGRSFGYFARYLPKGVERACFVNCDSVKSFDFSGCETLSDEQLAFYAEQIEEYPLVRELDLTGCSALTDECVEVLAEKVVPYMEVVRLSGTKLSRQGLATLLEAVKKDRLKALDLRGYDLEAEEIGAILVEYPNLVEVGISSKTVGDGEWRDSLRGAGQLKRVMLEMPKLTGEAYLDLGEALKDVEHLDLTGCVGMKVLRPLSGQLLRATLAPHRSFKLWIHKEYGIEDGDVEAFMQCGPKTEQLHLIGPALTDATLRVIAERMEGNVDELLLESPLYTDEGVGAIAAKLKDVTVVNLHRCPGITEVSLGHLAGSLEGNTHLTALQIEDCPGVKSLEPLKGKLQGCTALKEVSFHRCKAIAGEELDAFVKELPECVERVTFSETQVSDTGVRALIEGRFPQLKNIELYTCDNLTLEVVLELLVWARGEGREFAIRGSNQILELDLSGMEKVSDADLEMLLRAWPSRKTKRLDLSGCTEVTGEAVLGLIRYCEELEELSLAGCIALSVEEIGEVIAACAGTLKRLNLQGTAIDDATLLDQLGHFPPELESIDLRECEGVTGRSYARLLDVAQEVKVKGCPIERLDLSCLVGEEPVQGNLLGFDVFEGELHVDESIRNVSRTKRDRLNDAQVAGLLSDPPEGLKVLDLSNCPRLTDATLDLIIKLDFKELRDIRLANCKRFTPKGLQRFCTHYSNLKSLDLTGCRVGQQATSWIPLTLHWFGLGRSPFDVRKLPKFAAELSLQSVDFDDEKAKLLVEYLTWDGLESLDLRHNPKLGVEGLVLILQSLNSKKVRALYLPAEMEMTEGGLDTLFSYVARFKGLEELSFGGKILTGEKFEALCKGLGPSVVELEVAHAEQLTDADLLHLKGVEGLRRLSLCGWAKLTFGGVETLLKGLKQPLEALDLSETKIPRLSLRGLKGMAPQVLRSLVLPEGLRELDFAECAIQEEGAFLGLQVPTSVVSIDLTGCPACDDEALVHLTQGICEGLEVLKLRGTAVTDEGLERIIPSLAAAKVLDLSDCSLITDNTVSLIAHCCPNLEQLSLAGCVGLTEGGLRRLFEEGTLTRLKSLDLSGTRFSGRGPIAVPPKLEVLSARHCSRLRALAVRELAGQMQVESWLFDIKGCEGVTAEEQKELKALWLRKLEVGEHPKVEEGKRVHRLTLDQWVESPALADDLWELELVDAQEMTSEHFAEFMAGLPPHLLRLRIVGASKLVDDDLKVLVEGLKGVQELDLEGWTGVSGMGCVRLPRQLAELHLRGWTSLTDEGLQNIFRQMPGELQVLTVTGAPKVTGEGLEEVPNSPFSITLSGCGLTDEGIKRIAGRLSDDDLQDLDLSQNKGLTLQGVNFFLPRQLRRFNLAGCSGLNDQVVGELCFNGLQGLKEWDLSGCTGLSVGGILEVLDKVGGRCERLSFEGCEKEEGDGLVASKHGPIFSFDYGEALTDELFERFLHHYQGELGGVEIKEASAFKGTSLASVKGLKRIALAGFAFDEESLRAFIEGNAATLEELVIRDVPCDAETLSCLTTTDFPKLRLLHLEGLETMKDIYAEGIFPRAEGLVEVSFARSEKLTGSFLQTLGETELALERLNLRECPALERKWVVEFVRERAANLTLFQVEGCPAINPRDVDNLVVDEDFKWKGRKIPNWMRRVVIRPKASVDSGLSKYLSGQKVPFRALEFEAGWDDGETLVALLDGEWKELEEVLLPPDLPEDVLEKLTRVLPKGLRRLGLAHNPQLTDAHLKALCQKGVRHLDLSGCTGITEEGFVECVESLEPLEGLKVSGCKWFTHKMFELVVQKGSQTLVELDVKGCPLKDEDCNFLMFQKPVNLRRLNLGCLEGLSVETLKKLLPLLKELEFLGLSESTGLQSLPMIELLNRFGEGSLAMEVDGCPWFNDNLVTALWRRLSRSQLLNISNCEGLTEAGVGLLREHLGGLLIQGEGD